MNTMVQTGTFTGLVVASAINVGTNYLVWGWRLSLGLAAVPGAILLLGEQHKYSVLLVWCIAMLLRRRL